MITIKHNQGKSTVTRLRLSNFFGNIFCSLAACNIKPCSLASLKALAFVGHHCNCNELIAEECVQDNGAISGPVPPRQMVLHGWFCSLRAVRRTPAHDCIFIFTHDHSDIRG